jgi:hypothetical protein
MREEVVIVQTLQVVAVTSGGSHVLVADGEGTQYQLPIDDRLRAAVRGERVRQGQLEIALTSQLSPRDIQSQVRAGASVEDVAELAGVSTERVLRYAAPVLDERTHVARQARTALVRTEGLAEVGTLGPLVERSLAGRGAVGSLTWDAWRRDDGRWVVVNRWVEDQQERAALWLLDPAGRSAAAHDEGARRLAGLTVEQPPAPTRLAVVRDQPAAARPPVPALLASDVEDETPTGPIPTVAAASGTTPVSAAPSRSRPARPRPAASQDQRLWLGDDLDDLPKEDAERTGFTAAPAADTGTTAGSRRQRPPVPSWDEIMFGRRGGA